MRELVQFTVFGLMLGCVYSIAAMGLVLTYTVTGVFNFAHGAVGMLAAFVYFELHVEHHLPALIAVPLVVVVFAPALGIGVERLMRRFQGVDYATSLVVTIALTVALLGFAQRVFDPGKARYLPYLFGDHRFLIADVPISYDRIAQVFVAAAVAFGLRYVLFRTTTGARMRAVVDDRDLASLKGVRFRRVSRASWMVGFALAALGGVLFASGTNLSAVGLTLLVLNAYGAAMIGRLTSLPMTVVGALALGLCQELTNVTWLWPEGDVFVRFRLALPGLFLVVAVLLVPSFRLSAGRVVGRDEPAVPSLRRSVLSGGAILGIVMVAVQLSPTLHDTDILRGVVVATIALSLVALTGLSGQVSLAQYLFVGVGAFVAGKTFGGHSVAGMLLAGVASAVLAAVVALPAVRLRGLHLALSTFGIALAGRYLILGDPRVLGNQHGVLVGRPHIFGFATASDGAFAVWGAIVFVALALLVGVIRRSWFGRQLTAIRDSELAAATVGVPVRTAKVAAFALSGFIAGCAGALFGGLSTSVGPYQFDPVNSLVIVLFAFAGGVTTVLGACIAGALFALLAYTEATFPSLAGVLFVAVGAVAISLGRQPSGLAGVLLDRKARLRISS